MESPPHIQPDISVCTCLRKQPQTIRKLLQSLQETADPVSLEIFLVNLGVESDEELSQEFPDLKIFSLPGEKEVQACNQVMEIATGRYFMPIDHDVIIQPECLLRLVRFMDDTPDVGIAAPQILNAYGKTEPAARTFPTIFSGLQGLIDVVPATTSQDNREVEWLWSGAKIIRRELLEDINLPDASLPLYYSDMTYALRARQAGWHNFYIPAAMVIHPNPKRYDLQFGKPRFSPWAMLKFMKRKWFR